MFETETQEKIQNRMASTAAGEINTDEGSMFYLATAPMSVELLTAYSQLEQVLKLGFAQSSSGEYLDMRANEHGVYRKEQSKAEGVVRVEGSVGTEIPEGTLFATADGRTYESVGEAVIEVTYADVKIVATESGTAYNTTANAVVEMPVPVAGVTAIRNPLPISKGANTESDASLLERLLDHVRRPATSGNVYQYEQWAESITGIGGAKVMPLWAGAGTVKVVLINELREPADSVMVDEVKTYIESVRPIGAFVTYEAAEGVSINIEATVKLSQNAILETVEASFIQKLSDYLRGEVAFKMDSQQNSVQVSMAKIGSMLVTTEGVEDYSELLLNGETDSVVLTDLQVPVKGVIQIYEQS